MGHKSNTQLKLKLENVSNGEFEMKGVKVTYHDYSFIIKDDIYDFSDRFIKFITNPYVTYGDIDEDEKNKRLLLAIKYDIRKGDKRSSRYRTIECILEDRGDYYGRGFI